MFEKGHSPVAVINCAHWTQPYCFLVMLQGCPDQTKRYITLFWAKGLVMRSVIGSAMELEMLSVMGRSWGRSWVSVMVVKCQELLTIV